ncbi:MAG: hypothetical protein METHAR1v1_1250012 [Methanothrix sp.]|nr:MAG: hypothetical protein METHAR1v1_1250012 [Methanothrix sp.]
MIPAWLRRILSTRSLYTKKVEVEINWESLSRTIKGRIKGHLADERAAILKWPEKTE